MKSLLIFTTTAFAMAAGNNASASSSDWFDMEGARIRLVTAGVPDAQGRLKGVLDIQLKPGWKTYWRDPGDAGVPPTVDASSNPGISKTELEFPAPQRHDEGDFQWAGYDYPVGLPVIVTFKDPSSLSLIDADVFLGVCETICVPVQAKFTVDPTRDPDNADDMASVSSAFAAIPQAATPAFGVVVKSQPGSHNIVLEARFPGDPETAELFIAGDGSYTFTTPVREQRDGKTVFTTEVSLPARIGTGDGLHYTLVTDKGAVNGLLPYF